MSFWLFSLILALFKPTYCLFRHEISRTVYVGFDRFQCTFLHPHSVDFTINAMLEYSNSVWSTTNLKNSNFIYSTKLHYGNSVDFRRATQSGSAGLWRSLQTTPFVWFCQFLKFTFINPLVIYQIWGSLQRRYRFHLRLIDRFHWDVLHIYRPDG